MLRSSLHRLTTLVLLVTYVAATTLGGLLHDHGGCGEHEHVATCQYAGLDDERGDHDHDEAANEPGLTADIPNRTLLDDECAVCRFIAQRPMPVANGSIGVVCQLCVELHVEHASEPALSLQRTTHSRAPPLARVQLAG